MFDAQGRALLKQGTSYLARILARHTSADMLALIGLGFGLCASVALVFGWNLAGLVFFLINRIFDALDGAVARLQSPTRYGFVYDIVSDFVVYAAIPLAIAIELHTFGAMTVCALMLASYYINAGVWMSLSKVTEPEARGVIEGGETLIFYLCMIIWPAHFVIIGSVFSILVMLTAAFRVSRLLGLS